MIDAITLAIKSMDMEAQEAGRMFIEIEAVLFGFVT
jgi:hypothetical protein